jgi:hypothetical protein
MAFDFTITAGETSKIIEVMIRDSTTGGGKTAIAFGAVTASYVREGSTRTAITLAAGTAGAAYSSGKWAEVDATNCKGLYQLHVPDLALATGVDSVTLQLQISGVIDKTIRIALLGVNLRTVANMGVTGIPATGTANTVAPATPTNVSDVQTNVLAKLPAALVGGRIDASVGAVAANALTAAALAADAGSEIAAAVRTNLATELARIDENTSAAKTLTAGERTAVAVSVAADIMNDADGSAVMQAIADKIAADWVAGDASPVAIAAAVRTNLAAELALIDVAVSTRLATTGYTAPPASTAIRDAILDRVLAGNHVTAGTVGLLLQFLDAAITSRLATAGYTAPPSAATISGQVDTDLTAAHGAGSWSPGTGGDATAANQTAILGHLTDVKGGTWSGATDTLEEIRNAVDTITGGSGSGARVVTITVDDGTTVLENAVVRMAEGVNTYTATTNASGVAVFNLDDATYTASVSKTGYTFAGTTLVVDGVEAVTYSMAAVTITAPPTPTTATGILTILNEEGVAEQNVTISCQIESGPGTAGLGYDRKVWSEVSDVNGLVQFAGMVQGATYSVWRGEQRDATAASVTVPVATSFNIAELLGVD